MDGWHAGPRHGAANAALIAAALWLGAATQMTPNQLRALEAGRAADLARARDEATRQRAAEAEVGRLAQARVAAAAALRTLEQATADAATATQALAQRRAEAEARLQARAKALAPLLPLIERLSLYPAETLLAVPAPPERSVGGLLVLRGLARQLEVDGEALRAEQREVERLSQGLDQQERKLEAAQAAQARQAAGLDQQIAEAQARGRAAEGEGAAAARHAAEQAAQADSLRAALSQLDLSRRQEEARARADAAAAIRHKQDAAAADAKRREVALSIPAGPGLGPALGQLGAPVAGSVMHAFGEAGDAGPATGISFAAAPSARVSAPCGGRVVFAGPFRSYGQLMIIDCGGGYHFVLAGMDRLDVAVGRPVQPGEPIGVMAAWDARSAAARPTLYVELREHGQPINPAPYLHMRP